MNIYLPPLLRLAKLILCSRKNGTLDSVQGFWCRPITTHGSFLHNSNKCYKVQKKVDFKVQYYKTSFLTLWAKSWWRYNQSSKAKLVNTSLDWLIKTCLTGSLRAVDTGLPGKFRVANCRTNCLNILEKCVSWTKDFSLKLTLWWSRSRRENQVRMDFHRQMEPIDSHIHSWGHQMHRWDFNSVEIISSFTHWIHGWFFFLLKMG